MLTVTDPKIQIAEVGSTVRFRCSGQSLVGRQVLLRWGKEGDSLPAGRAQDDRRGVLIITDVRHTDSGTYVCSGQDGINVVTETVVLNVGGELPFSFRMTYRAVDSVVSPSRCRLVFLTLPLTILMPLF